MKLIPAILILVCLSANANKTADLKAACLDNPTHIICVECAEKAAARKARRDAKLQAQIDAVRSDRPVDRNAQAPTH